MSTNRSTMIGVALLSMTLFAFISGCNKSNPVSSDESAVGVIPLTIGNTWEYSGVTYDTTSEVAERYSELMNVQRDSIIFGRHMYLYGSWSTNTDSGLIVGGGFSYVPDPPPPHDTIPAWWLVYQYPTKQGESYRSIGSAIVVGSIDTVIAVTAGSFHCIDYKQYCQGDLFSEDYICPGIGRIKYVGYFGPDFPSQAAMVRTVVELKQYTVK